jgi:hypothetical protein
MYPQPNSASQSKGNFAQKQIGFLKTSGLPIDHLILVIKTYQSLSFFSHFSPRAFKATLRGEAKQRIISLQ